MPYDDHSEFPRSWTSILDLADSAQTLVALNTRARISHITVGCVTSGTVTFQTITGSTQIMKVTLPDGRGITIPGWLTDTLGVEVISDQVTTGDINVTAFFRTD
jgi:hypothetical protein